MYLLDTNVVSGLRRRDRADPRLLDWVDAVSLLHVPDPKPERDAMVAATALVHRLTLITRNVRDFAGIGVQIVDPWTVKSPALMLPEGETQRL